MALWSGRFEKAVSAFTQEFGASLPTDTSMYDQDIRGSLAHAKMLAAQGVISDEDYAAIERGISHIKSQMDEGAFAFDVNDEDIHMAVEGRLISDIGSAGARLHTGRSRNDQVATDIRLYAKDAIADLLAVNCELRRAFFDKADECFGIVMPGYTHL